MIENLVDEALFYEGMGFIQKLNEENSCVISNDAAVINGTSWRVVCRCVDLCLGAVYRNYAE
jgi:hypothetical protein